MNWVLWPSRQCFNEIGPVNIQQSCGYSGHYQDDYDRIGTTYIALSKHQLKTIGQQQRGGQLLLEVALSFPLYEVPFRKGFCIVTFQQTSRQKIGHGVIAKSAIVLYNRRVRRGFNRGYVIHDGKKTL